MRNRQRRRLRVLPLLAVVIIASASYAFTASNTVPASTAGSGATAISGYTASAVAYNLNATTPTNVDSVSFTLNPTAAGTVKIQVVSGGSWYSCTNTAGSVSCPTTSPQATVVAATQLTILAVQ